MKEQIDKGFIRHFMGFLLSFGFLQVFFLLSVPLLGRLYSAGALGDFALFRSLVLAGALLSTLRYEAAIMLPAANTEAKIVLNTCLRLSFVISTALLVPGFAAASGGRLSFSAFQVVLLFCSIWFSGWQVSLANWNNRLQQFKSNALNKTIQALLVIFFTLILYPLETNGLMLAYTIGLAGSVFLYSRDRFSKRDARLSRFLKPGSSWPTLLKYKSIFLYSFPASFLNNISGSIPVFLLGPLFSNTTLGLYAAGHALVQIPLGLATQALGQLSYQKMAEMHRNAENLRLYFKEIIQFVLKYVFLPWLCIVVFAPDLFAGVMGKSWETAGVYTRLLAPWVLLTVVSSPLSQVLIVLNRQNQYLFFEVLLFAARVAAVWAGYYYFQDAYYAVLFFGISGFVYHLFFLFYLFYIAKPSDTTAP